jgi:hypothetical protein
VNVGNCAGCDFRNENPSPNISAGLIRSINRDSARLFSAVDESYSDVDWTAPVLGAINDGSTSDIDTTYNLTLIEGNWMNATDSNSAVTAYWYAIGTTPGDSDFVAWTNNGSSTAFSIPATLIAGQWYYISLRAINGAGLVSLADSSDGQIADLGLNISGSAVTWSCWPNPVKDQLRIASSAGRVDHVAVTDLVGRTVHVSVVNTEDGMVVDMGPLAAGEYIVQIMSGSGISVVKIIKE